MSMKLIRIVNRGICGTVERLLPLSLLLMMLSLGMSGLSSASVAEANVTPSASLETETGQSASSEWDVAAPDYTVDALPARISTSTGTWMSLDVSPDGRQVVFD